MLEVVWSAMPGTGLIARVAVGILFGNIDRSIDIGDNLKSAMRCRKEMREKEMRMWDDVGGVKQRSSHYLRQTSHLPQLQLVYVGSAGDSFRYQSTLSFKNEGV